MENNNTESKDKAFGSVLGAFVGDAIGAYLEFFNSKINEKDVERAFLMLGGGKLDVGPGQITDDSEMAMCLLNGLTQANRNSSEDYNRTLTIDID